MRQFALATALLSSAIYAQNGTSQSLRKADIDINGVSLRLGMMKPQVIDKLADNKLNKIDEDMWVVASGAGQNSEVQFTNGRLSFAERPWSNGEGDITEPLFGLVNSLNQEGFSACNIVADVKSDPTMTAHRVSMNCGEK